MQRATILGNGTHKISCDCGYQTTFPASTIIGDAPFAYRPEPPKQHTGIPHTLSTAELPRVSTAEGWTTP